MRRKQRCDICGTPYHRRQLILVWEWNGRRWRQARWHLCVNTDCFNLGWTVSKIMDRRRRVA